MRREADRTTIDRVAELGLANAVLAWHGLAWRERSSVGFRRFARSSIVRELSTR